MHVVDGEGGREAVGSVASGGKQAGAEEKSEAAGDVVFDGWGDSPGAAGTGVEQDRGRGGCEVVSADRSVGLIAKSDVGGQDPALGEGVFASGVEQDGCSGP